MNKQVDFEYTTNSLELAAYLQTVGKRLVDVRKSDQRRALFVFLDVQDSDIQTFFNKEDSVHALDYSNNYKSLKSMIYTKLEESKAPNQLKTPQGDSLRYKV